LFAETTFESLLQRFERRDRGSPVGTYKVLRQRWIGPAVAARRRRLRAPRRPARREPDRGESGGGATKPWPRPFAWTESPPGNRRFGPLHSATFRANDKARPATCISPASAEVLRRAGG